MMAKDNGDVHPIVEAPRDIIQYLNRGAMLKAFDKVKFCIYHGVVVCEEGTKDEVLERLDDSTHMGPHDFMKKHPAKR